MGCVVAKILPIELLSMDNGDSPNQGHGGDDDGGDHLGGDDGGDCEDLHHLDHLLGYFSSYASVLLINDNRASVNSNWKYKQCSLKFEFSNGGTVHLQFNLNENKTK